MSIDYYTKLKFSDKVRIARHGDLALQIAVIRDYTQLAGFEVFR